MPMPLPPLPDPEPLPLRAGTVVDYWFDDPDFNNQRRVNRGYVLMSVDGSALGFNWLVLTEDGTTVGVSEDDIQQRVFLHYPCRSCAKYDLSCIGLGGPGKPDGPEDMNEVGGRWTCHTYQQSGRLVRP